MQNGSEIGSEYILEIVGKDGRIKNKKFYFHCILCNSDIVKEIDEHKVSNDHRLAFLNRHYPTIAATIKSRNLHSPSSIKSILTWVFNAIYEHHARFMSHVSPQVNLVNYAEKGDDINSEILNQPHAYNLNEEFVGVLEKLIEGQFKSKMENNETKVIESPIDDAVQNLISQKNKLEKEKITKKYNKFVKRPDRHPDYMNEWREFYLNFSRFLASAAIVDEKYYNYIYDFRNHFLKYLESKKQAEILQKQKEIEEDVKCNKSQEMLEPISDESDGDYDIKLIEKPVVTVEVSSDDDSGESVEPVAKKQKFEDDSIPIHKMLRCIEIAYKLIQRGEKPTIDGIKRAFDFKVERFSTSDFYNRHNFDHFDFGQRKSPPNFISFSPARETSHLFPQNDFEMFPENLNDNHFTNISKIN